MGCASRLRHELLRISRGHSLSNRLSSLTKDAVAASLALSPNHPRHRHALHALTAMDSRIESVGESRSLALFLHEHLPLPEPQVDIHDARGFAGRVDFLWREQRTIGDPEDALWNEKLREDRLRDAGWEVARWTWADLSTPSLVASRILAAFARSHGALERRNAGWSESEHLPVEGQLGV
eukprot:gene23696-28400_t